MLAVVAGIVLFVAVALAVAYPNLPDISDLSDYRPNHHAVCRVDAQRKLGTIV